MSSQIIIYNASAGSGKTYQLSLNYLKLLNFSQQDIFSHLKNLLAITFTNKAAFEMKERIINFLKEIYKQTEKGRILSKDTGINPEKAEKILNEIFLNYEALQVKTIDSFLLTLYKAFSYELNMVSDFQIKSYIDEKFIEKAFNLLFEEAEKNEVLFNFLESFIDLCLEEEKKLRIDIKNKLVNDFKKFFTKLTYKKEIVDLINVYQKFDFSKKDKVGYYLKLYDYLAEKLEEVLNKEKILFIGLWKEKLSTFLSQFIPWIYVKLGNLEGIIIDELQDTDRLQWEAIFPIVEDLISRGKTLICAGDPKQSIFKWRGGDPFILEEIKKNFSSYGVKIEVLKNNYRSCPEIVNFNNTFFSQIKENEHLKRKIIEDLIFGKNKNFAGKEEIIAQILEEINWGFSNIFQNAVQEFKGKVEIRVLKLQEKTFQNNSFREIKEEIKELTKKEIVEILKEIKEKDVAILVRKNEDINEISSFLISEGFNVIGSSFLKLKESPLINTFVSLLRFINYPEDEIALAGYLSSGLIDEGIYILKNFYELKIREININLIDFVRNEYPLFWNEWIEDILEMSKYLSLYDLCRYITKKLKIKEKRKEEVSYLHKFLSVILDFSFKGGDLEDFLEYWEKYADDELEIPKDEKAIKVFTIHLAKGLEFENVILPLIWEEQIFRPDLNLIIYKDKIYVGRKDELPQEGQIGWYIEKGKAKIEIFNLLYVAFTRAIKNLYIIIPDIKYIKNKRRYEAVSILNKILSYLPKEKVLSINSLSSL